MRRLVGTILTVSILVAAALASAVASEMKGEFRALLETARADGKDVVLAEDIDLVSTASPEMKQTILPLLQAAAADELPDLKIDYPLDGSIFPPEIIAATFLWHDPAEEADFWLIHVALDKGASHLYVLATTDPLPPGEIDPTCLGPNNEVYKLTPYQASTKNWTPSPEVWTAIKRCSVEQQTTVTIVGAHSADPTRPLSRGHMTMKTSRHPVGAPIFYRDVPLMPSKTQKGIIKPLAQEAVSLIAWRLRDISKPQSRLLLTNMPTCANCHSFSADGKTLGMDMDGPSGDKGSYAMAPIEKQMVIRREHLITWNSFKEKPKGHKTIGFLSQISPDGKYAVTTLNEELYVANFTNYKFLQVFYPTRGILAYYSASTGEMKALPGASDPNYVQCDPAWSPDGKEIIFARAQAIPPYLPGKELAFYANDPTERKIQYDLYRMPFNEGRGGQALPIPGASKNGMSNTFPKVSPDGKYIVFVQCANGQLMRPDGKLWIVPAAGGRARLMRCNTALMNSWHSFSPNSRWMVFSSKINTPYTQMFLTHIDEHGNDSPALLIPNATAANRAVNIPEFVNIPYDAFLSIAAPAIEYFRHLNRATELVQRDGRWEDAIPELREALQKEPDDAGIHNSLGVALSQVGQLSEAITHFRKAVQIDPHNVEPRYNLSVALFIQEDIEEAIRHFQEAFQISPRLQTMGQACALGLASPIRGQPGQIVSRCHRTLQRDPTDLSALFALACIRAADASPKLRSGNEAVALATRACMLTSYASPELLDVLAGAYAEADRFDQAVRLAEFAHWLARAAGSESLAGGITRRLQLYKQGAPFRRPASR